MTEEELKQLFALLKISGQPPDKDFTLEIAFQKESNDWKVDAHLISAAASEIDHASDVSTTIVPKPYEIWAPGVKEFMEQHSIPIYNFTISEDGLAPYPPPKSAVIINKGALNSGKSHSIKSFIQSHPTLKVVIVVPIRMLSYDIAQYLEIQNYQELPKGPITELSRNLVICAKSLYRLEVIPDVIIFDEFSDTLEQLTAPNFYEEVQHAVHCWTKIKYYIQHSTQVFIFDAFVGLPVFDLLKQVHRLDDLSVYSTPSIYNSWKDLGSTYEEHLVQSIQKKQNVALFFGSKTECMRCHDLLRSIFGKKLNIGLYVGGDNEETTYEKYLTSKKNDFAHEVLLASPALRSGFNITISDHYHHRYLIACQQIGDARFALQASARVRNPIQSDIYFSAISIKKPDFTERTLNNRILQYYTKRSELLYGLGYLPENVQNIPFDFIRIREFISLDSKRLGHGWLGTWIRNHLTTEAISPLQDSINYTAQKKELEDKHKRKAFEQGWISYDRQQLLAKYGFAEELALFKTFQGYRSEAPLVFNPFCTPYEIMMKASRRIDANRFDYNIEIWKHIFELDTKGSVSKLQQESFSKHIKTSKHVLSSNKVKQYHAILCLLGCKLQNLNQNIIVPQNTVDKAFEYVQKNTSLLKKLNIPHNYKSSNKWLGPFLKSINIEYECNTQSKEAIGSHFILKVGSIKLNRYLSLENQPKILLTEGEIVLCELIALREEFLSSIHYFGNTNQAEAIQDRADGIVHSLLQVTGKESITHFPLFEHLFPRWHANIKADNGKFIKRAHATISMVETMLLQQQSAPAYLQAKMTPSMRKGALIDYLFLLFGISKTSVALPLILSEQSISSFNTFWKQNPAILEELGLANFANYEQGCTFSNLCRYCNFTTISLHQMNTKFKGTNLKTAQKRLATLEKLNELLPIKAAAYEYTVSCFKNTTFQGYSIFHHEIERIYKIYQSKIYTSKVQSAYQLFSLSDFDDKAPNTFTETCALGRDDAELKFYLRSFLVKAPVGSLQKTPASDILSHPFNLAFLNNSILVYKDSDTSKPVSCVTTPVLKYDSTSFHETIVRDFTSMKQIAFDAKWVSKSGILYADKKMQIHSINLQRIKQYIYHKLIISNGIDTINECHAQYVQWLSFLVGQLVARQENLQIIWDGVCYLDIPCQVLKEKSHNSESIQAYIPILFEIILDTHLKIFIELFRKLIASDDDLMESLNKKINLYKLDPKTPIAVGNKFNPRLHSIIDIGYIDKERLILTLKESNYLTLLPFSYQQDINTIKMFINYKLMEAHTRLGVFFHHSLLIN